MADGSTITVNRTCGVCGQSYSVSLTVPKGGSADMSVSHDNCPGPRPPQESK